MYNQNHGSIDSTHEYRRKFRLCRKSWSSRQGLRPSNALQSMLLTSGSRSLPQHVASPLDENDVEWSLAAQGGRMRRGGEFRGLPSFDPGHLRHNSQPPSSLHSQSSLSQRLLTLLTTLHPVLWSCTQPRRGPLPSRTGSLFAPFIIINIGPSCRYKLRI